MSGAAEYSVVSSSLLIKDFAAGTGSTIVVEKVDVAAIVSRGIGVALACCGLTFLDSSALGG